MKTALIPNNIAQSQKISILPPQGNWDFLGKGRMRAGLRFFEFPEGKYDGACKGGMDVFWIYTFCFGNKNYASKNRIAPPCYTYSLV